MNKIRVSVPLSIKIHKILLEKSRLLGISLPTYIAMIIGKYLWEEDLLKVDLGEKDVSTLY